MIEYIAIHVLSQWSVTRRSECKVFLERTIGLGIVLQGAEHCKSVRTLLFKRCTYAMPLFRHCFKRTYAWQGQFMQ